MFLWLSLVTPSFCQCKFTMLTSDQSLFYTLYYVSKRYNGI
jgi:hypothetical protein